MDSNYDAYLSRGLLSQQDYLHGILGPMEHQQFARDAVSRNPLMSIPLGFGIPFYTGAKALGLTQARSAPSLDEVLAAYSGIAQGMRDYFRR
jgi:hypothetical protein